VEPRSSMMVTSTQGSPCCCSSARALIQTVLLMVLSFVVPEGMRLLLYERACSRKCARRLLRRCVKKLREQVRSYSSVRGFHHGFDYGGCLLLQLAHLLDAPEHPLRRCRRIDLRLHLVVRQARH